MGLGGRVEHPEGQEAITFSTGKYGSVHRNAHSPPRAHGKFDKTGLPVASGLFEQADPPLAAVI
jgi:hypothetical protein